MHDFQCKKAEDMYNKKLAERVGYFKSSEKGAFKMCEIMDRITKKEREKERIETTLQYIKNILPSFDMSPKKAMEFLKIDEEEQEKYLDLLGLKA